MIILLRSVDNSGQCNQFYLEKWKT